jgi:hypothetical protein
MTMSSTAALSAVNQLSALLEMMRDPNKAQETIDAIKVATEKHEAAAKEARELALKLQERAAENAERERKIVAIDADLKRRSDEHDVKVKECNDSFAKTATAQIQKQAQLTAQANDLSAQRDAHTMALKDFEQKKQQWVAQADQRTTELQKSLDAVKKREAAVADAETRIRSARENIAREAAHL